MPEILFDRQRAALTELYRLIEERRQGEEELNTSCAKTEESSNEEGDKTRQSLAAMHERELNELDESYELDQAELKHRQETEEAAAQKSFADSRRRQESAEKEERGRVEGELKDALWMGESVSEGGQKRVQQQLEAVRRQVNGCEERIEALWTEAEPLLARVDLDRDDVEPSAKALKADESRGDLEVPLQRADELLRKMQHLKVLPWTSWTATVGTAVIACGAGVVPALWMRPLLFWLLGGVMGGFLVTIASRFILLAVARRKLRNGGRRFALLLAQARERGKTLADETEAWAVEQRNELRTKHGVERRKAEALHRPRLEELTRRYRAEREGLEQQFQITFQALRNQMRQANELSQQRYQNARSKTLARQDRERRDAATANAERLYNLQLTRSQRAEQLRKQWETGTSQLLATFREMQAVRDSLFGDSQVLDEAVALVGAISAGLPFGSLTIDVQKLANGLPAEKLTPLPLQPLDLPAFLPFPRLGGFMLHALGQGRPVAVQSLQAMMLRFLTALPPGKVRFTIFDPVGLGDNFAAFMHLADHDEALVTSRIWTEPSHIEKQLADLTVHMENVIQKYLRSQFTSIEDYNARAGEVAEPYRILVVANFPVNFTPQAARRLVSIVQSGSSCGVYALISFDTRQPLPQGFQIEDLEQLCLNLHWRTGVTSDQWSVVSKDKEDGEQDQSPKERSSLTTGHSPLSTGRFTWGDPEMDRYPLAMDMPPEASKVIETVRRVGALSKDATRVRVPFSFIAPRPDQVWQGDSRRGITVPLGRLGAVRQLALQLGQGTSQHVLVAGKTGSGKSTLWHALISNLALIYGPDEVELYLIDFKKGVEFKLYAVSQLPHARVIAIESEREFGLSVLQRLDAELRQRGDLFRAAGVNDIAGYRDANPDTRCPRILLIVDEFQEFFIEDDRLSQEAALLLDRLVRQGRAFGLHILLGSQTLGGAYSLARSTIDQMAVRIALQCSEADAQLILNKDNSAARLLSRPGEAIYNDTNGSLEGNEVFQIVWLPEEEREQVLAGVHQRATSESLGVRLPLVFEGNTPAELDRNPLLTRLLTQVRSASEGIDETLAASLSGFAWLGDAIAIKDPTAAVFRAQTGSNLLIVGQNDEAALAILASSFISLAVQQPLAHFLVLDGSAPHEPYSGYLKDVMTGWPGAMERVERPGLGAALAGLADEMNQRLKGTSTDRSVRYVLINGLQRYREFRRSDDDLGFGRRGAERTVSPLEHLQALLRDGPVVGIHLLMWCDSLVNVMRSLDRQGLRECGQRVLFQMNAADSSHLLDSPIASKLGRNRALYSTDEMAQPEKFRPYGLPPLGWVAEVKSRLAEKSALVSPAKE